MRSEPELDFEWRVAVEGYEWVEIDGWSGGSPVFRTEYSQVPSRLRSRSAATKSYRPLRQFPNLFRELAQLADAGEDFPDRVRKFANQYGLLGPAPEPSTFDERTRDFADRGGVTLAPSVEEVFFDDWLGAIHNMRAAIELWGLVCCRREQRVQNALRLKEQIVWGGGLPYWKPPRWGRPMPVPIASAKEVEKLAWKKGEVVRPTRHYLRTLINSNLKALLYPHVEWPSANSIKMTLSRAPQTLIGAIWLQFARDFCREQAASVKCQVCQEEFVLSHKRGMGHRADTLFCSDACRQADYRDRLRQARTLHRQGKPIGDIATALRSTPQTVRQWVRRRG